MALLDYLVAFIPMLGILIFVHELGHFLVAKACGVRVLKFSLGFGPPIGIGNFRLRWERGGTEYVIAWIPLGGYVKMLGENLEIQGEEPDPATLERTGKFWRPFAPVSGSPGSFGVGPAPPDQLESRSMPSAPLAKMRLRLSRSPLTR